MTTAADYYRGKMSDHLLDAPIIRTPAEDAAAERYVRRKCDDAATMLDALGLGGAA